MKKEFRLNKLLLTFFLGSIGFIGQTLAQGIQADIHAPWDAILKKIVNEKGRVRYKDLADLKTPLRSEFNSYLENLEKISLATFETWTANDQKAFLINAYNAFTVKLILDNPGVKSIKDIGSFLTKPWSLKFFKLFAGRVEALDPIEHDWLRPKFKDYRIHAAVNCASISCPLLRAEAYSGANLDEQLDQQMTVWLDDPSKNQCDLLSGKLKLSKIFNWYGDDFKNWGGGIAKVFEKHSHGNCLLAIKTNSKADISYFDYDWQLNAAN